MDSEWLKFQFEINPDRNKAELARALSLDAPAVSKMLSGKRQIKAREYLEMRRFFGLPVDGEKAVSGRPGDQGKPLEGQARYIIAPLARAFGDGEQQPGGESWVMPASLFTQRTKAASDKIKIFTVQERAMTPDFQLGEPVLVDLSDRKPSPPGVFLLSDGVGLLMRQCEIVRQSAPLRIRVSAIQPSYEPYEAEFEQADIVGRVIAKLQWL